MPDSPERIGRATSHIHNNINSKLPLSELADKACMSLHHFARKFREITGKTPKAYVRDARIECAACRLRKGVAIAVVAIACGFSSQAHLTRAFKARTGMTPAQYQKAGLTPQG